MSRALLLLGLPLLFGAACALKPIDPWRRGAWALERQDLDAALGAFDEVPLQHVRYPESRVAALAVQRTMRHCDELLRDALQLRSEGRDAEALAVLHRVKALWVGAPGVDELLAATERRQRLARPARDVAAPVAKPPVATPPAASVASSTPAVPAPPQGGAPPAVPPTTVPPPVSSPEPAAVASAAAEPSPAVPAEPESTGHVGAAPPLATPPAAAEPVVSASPAPPVVPAATDPATGGDAVTAALVQVEARLVRGEREAAIADLLALASQWPEDMRVRVRVSRLLHQRALVRYGEGILDGAIADWRRVLELDPAHATAATLLRAAEREALQTSRGS